MVERKPHRACICCDANAWQPHFVATSQHGRAFVFLHCGSCGLVALDTRSAAGIADAYDDSYYGGGETKLVGGLHGVRVRHAGIKAARIARLSDPGQKRAFDIGCGEGLFVRAMLDRGWRVDGNEIGARTLLRAQQRTGSQLHGCDLLDIPLKEGAYDAVTMWQVFEHLEQPVETLAKTHRMLKVGGLLAISVPNAGSWQARAFGRHWLHLDPPRHIHLFNPQNLSALLQKFGFAPFLRVGSPLEFGPIGYVQSAMNAAGIRRDAFFDLLKTATDHGAGLHLRNAPLIGLAAMLTPPGILMSLLESATGSSGTFELYAKKVARS